MSVALNLLNARPHPGPLPRGEGESFTVAGKFGPTSFAAHLSAKSQEAEIAQEAAELSEVARLLFPLLGGESGCHTILARGRKFETPHVVSYE
jgi:hypothetical protein